MLYTIDRLYAHLVPKASSPASCKAVWTRHKPLDLVVFLLDITNVYLLDIRNLEEVLRAGAAHAQDGTLALAVLLLALEAADFGSAVLLFVLAVRFKSLANLHVVSQGDYVCWTV